MSPPIRSLVDYASRWDPGFGSRIRGAAADRIAALEALVGRPLPPSYREFLLLMGEDQGGLKLRGDCDTSLEAVLEFYRSLEGETSEAVPADAVVFGVGGMVELILDAGAGATSVSESEEGARGERLSDSLENFVYRKVFQKCLLRGFPNRVNLSIDDPGLFEKAKAVALRLGFTGLEFSDSAAFCGESKDGSAIDIGRSKRSLIVIVTASDAARTKAVEDAFKGELGAARI